MERILKPSILFFYSDWCGPSQAFRPILEHALELYKDNFQPLKCLNYEMSSVEEIKRWKVLGVPTTILISRYGRELGRLVGYNKYDYVLNFLRKGVL